MIVKHVTLAKHPIPRVRTYFIGLPPSISSRKQSPGWCSISYNKTHHQNGIQNLKPHSLKLLPWARCQWQLHTSRHPTHRHLAQAPQPRQLHSSHNLSLYPNIYLQISTCDWHRTMEDALRPRRTLPRLTAEERERSEALGQERY